MHSEKCITTPSKNVLVAVTHILFVLSHSQKKKTKRRKKKKNSNAQVQNTPEALEETWQIVSQELRASGFQVCLLGFASLSVEVECTGLYLNECHKGP